MTKEAANMKSKDKKKIKQKNRLRIVKMIKKNCLMFQT